MLNGDGEHHPNDEEEDALLKESTASFADWIANFIRRVILLLENLPEEGSDGTPRSGETEGGVSFCRLLYGMLTVEHSSSR